MKKEYLSLGGLFVALHLIFILLSKFLPGSSLLLVLFLPLLSAVYAIKFDAKKIAVFSLAVFFLCIIFEPVSTFIYVVPALICGIVYGVLRKKKVKELSLVYLSSLAHSISLLITFLFISILFKEIHFFDIFKNFITISGDGFYLCIYLTLLLLGLIEAFLTHIITNSELDKLGFDKLQDEENVPNWLVFLLITTFIIYTIVYFIKPIYSVYFLPFIIGLGVPIVVEFILENKHKWIYFICFVIFFINLFLVGKIPHLLLPIILVSVFSPIFLIKVTTVLHTIKLNYLNKKKNIIK